MITVPTAVVLMTTMGATVMRGMSSMATGIAVRGVIVGVFTVVGRQMTLVDLLGDAQVVPVRHDRLLTRGRLATTINARLDVFIQYPPRVPSSSVHAGGSLRSRHAVMP